MGFQVEFHGVRISLDFDSWWAWTFSDMSVTFTAARYNHEVKAVDDNPLQESGHVFF